MNSPPHPIGQEELMAFLDGELSAERAEHVATHLSECGDCRAAIAESRGLSGRLAGWQVEPAPPSLSQNVTAAVTARELKPPGAEGTVRPRIFGLPRWVWGTAGAVCLVLLIAAVSIPNLLRSRIAANQAASRSREYRLAVDESEAQVAQTSEFPHTTGGGGGGIGGGVGGGVVGGVVGGSGRFWGAAKGSMGKLQYGQGTAGETNQPITGPMIVRTASLKLLTKDFDKTREALETAVRRHRGYNAQLTVSTETGSAHLLSATFRVPADQLDATIVEIKQLAHVEQESQGGEEVTEQYVDLTARLSNARRTEQTLLDVLEKRTGKLSEVLEVEQELARVREEIERMEAELKSLQNRVSFATLQVELRDEYKAEIEFNPPSIGGRMRNALVEGYSAAVDSMVGMILFLLKVGPFLLLWSLILFLPARYVWRRVHKAMAKK
jgi:uncharacterized small protein (DUF1192 family)